MKVLVSAASKHGATAELAAAIGEGLRRRDHHVVVLAPEYVGSLCGFDAAVIGSAVYGGHWLEPAIDLVTRNADGLRPRQVWLFSSGPVGDPSRKLVQKMGASPVELPDLLRKSGAREHRTFPGRLDRENLSLPQRAALTLFRGLEGDFRDWAEVDRWAAGIAEALQPVGATAA